MTMAQIAVLAVVGAISLAAAIPMLNSYRIETYYAGWAAAATGMLLIMSAGILVAIASTEVTAEEPLSLHLLLNADSIEVVPDSNWGRVLGLDPKYAPYIVSCKVEN